MANTKTLLAERGKTHGSFADNARVSQSIKALLRNEPGWSGLTEIQREAIDMICCKLSRILSGQGGFADHWSDICGYSELARKETE